MRGEFECVCAHLISVCAEPILPIRRIRTLHFLRRAPRTLGSALCMCDESLSMGSQTTQKWDETARY